MSGWVHCAQHGLTPMSPPDADGHCYCVKCLEEGLAKAKAPPVRPQGSFSMGTSVPYEPCPLCKGTCTH